MKTRTGYNRLQGMAAALALGLAGAWLGEGGLAGAEPASPAPGRRVVLEYREVKSSLTSWGLPTTALSTPFKAEPKLGGRRVMRGVWGFGGDAKHSLNWIWDSAEGKLYVDLNRNGNLTDDPTGVFTCREGTERSKSYQTFTDVRLPFQSPMGSHRVLGDISLYNYSGSQPSGYFGCRSYWSGRLAQAGREWEVGLVENITAELGSASAGHLVVRRWESRDEGFDLQNGALEGFPFCQEVFFGKQSYSVSGFYGGQGGAARYELSFQERAVPLGELKLSGQYIKRLLLRRQNPSAIVVVDMPGAVVRVPVGSYTGSAEVVVKQGGVEAYRPANGYGGTGPRLVISTNQPATLAAGGPLTNSVSVTRRSRSLNLNYQLVGAGGEIYKLQGALKQPEFTISRAGKRIASGKFEFG